MQVAQLERVVTDASAKHLCPVHEWLAAAPGAVAGLAARERCLLTVATLEDDEVMWVGMACPCGAALAFRRAPVVPAADP